MARIKEQELQEWLDALDNIKEHKGVKATKFLLEQLHEHANISPFNTPFVNTVDTHSVNLDFTTEQEIENLIRWNATIMVLKAQKTAKELGGHIATYASISTLYEVGFNHFFQGKSKEQLQDLVFYQGHSAPGVYARAFLEGRLQPKDLDNFRQEALQKGLSSYPHPYLMPNFWEFATVSMGLGPMQAIYQARCDKFLCNIGKLATKRKIWAFVGDGETDEPESLAAIELASRENLDNLIFVINCNLQRLDGPVRGNGKIIQELERRFYASNWEVIKIIWGSEFSALLDTKLGAKLQHILENMVDGELQNLSSKSGEYIIEHLFKANNLEDLIKDYTPKQIEDFKKGGHEYALVYSAYAKAIKANKPVVILANTVKGYGFKSVGQGKNIAHNLKSLTNEDLLAYRDNLNIPLTDKEVENFAYVSANTRQLQVLKDNRAKLHGFIPTRYDLAKALPKLNQNDFKELIEPSDREFSTTMALVRALSILLKNPAYKNHIIPITPDESRTFGMEGLFRQYGIYSSCGQLYDPEDNDELMAYKESQTGIILEEGLTEAGAYASWLALATSYSTRNINMVPFYIYYSMFGFNRIGDFIWAGADMQAKGFLIGATSGRTTLGGEGLQHNDGHNLTCFGFIPNCKSYDIAYAFELAIILTHGFNEMYVKNTKVFYYLAVTNAMYPHAKMPKNAKAGILKGMYLFKGAKHAQVELLGSGAIMQEVEAGAKILAKLGIECNIWGVTSFSELHKEGLDQKRKQRLHDKAAQTHVQKCLCNNLPVIAATDYVSMQAEQIRSQIDASYTVLGTDGFGRSDTRANLREFHEVNAKHIAYAAICALKLDKQKKFAKLKPKANVKHPMYR